MRGILVLIAVAAIVIVVLISLGFIKIGQTQTAQLPSVSVNGGQAPKFDVNVGKVDVGMENKTVAVPKVSVEQPANAQ